MNGWLNNRSLLFVDPVQQTSVVHSLETLHSKTRSRKRKHKDEVYPNNTEQTTCTSELKHANLSEGESLTSSDCIQCVPESQRTEVSEN